MSSSKWRIRSWWYHSASRGRNKHCGGDHRVAPPVTVGQPGSNASTNMWDRFIRHCPSSFADFTRSGHRRWREDSSTNSIHLSPTGGLALARCTQLTWPINHEMIHSRCIYSRQGNIILSLMLTTVTAIITKLNLYLRLSKLIFVKLTSTPINAWNDLSGATSKVIYLSFYPHLLTLFSFFLTYWINIEDHIDSIEIFLEGCLFLK